MEEDSWEIGIEHGAWGMESDDRGQKADDPSEIVAAGEFHGASRRQMAAFEF